MQKSGIRHGQRQGQRSALRYASPARSLVYLSGYGLSEFREFIDFQTPLPMKMR